MKVLALVCVRTKAMARAATTGHDGGERIQVPPTASVRAAGRAKKIEYCGEPVYGRRHFR